MRVCAAAAMTLLSSLGTLSSARADEGPAATAAEQRGYGPVDSASVVARSVPRFDMPARVIAPRHRGVGLMRWGAIMATLSYGFFALDALVDSSPSPYRFWLLVPLVGVPLAVPQAAASGEGLGLPFFFSTWPQFVGLTMILMGIVEASAWPSQAPRTTVRPVLGPGFVGLAVAFG